MFGSFAWCRACLSTAFSNSQKKKVTDGFAWYVAFISMQIGQFKREQRRLAKSLYSRSSKIAVRILWLCWAERHTTPKTSWRDSKNLIDNIWRVRAGKWLVEEAVQYRKIVDWIASRCPLNLVRKIQTKGRVYRKQKSSQGQGQNMYMYDSWSASFPIS